MQESQLTPGKKNHNKVTISHNCPNQAMVRDQKWSKLIALLAPQTFSTLISDPTDTFRVFKANILKRRY